MMPRDILRPAHSGVEDPADLPGVVRDACALRYGSDFDESALLEAMRSIIRALDLQGIPHVLVGGLALIQYVEGRNTRDIDLILAAKDLGRIPGFVLRECNDMFASGECGSLRIDVLLADHEFFAEVARVHSEIRQFKDGQLRCATPEGILLLKLFALPSLYRQGQIDRAAIYETDIFQLLRRHPMAPALLLEQLRPHLPESDLRALGQVLDEIQGRIAKPTRFGDNRSAPSIP